MVSRPTVLDLIVHCSRCGLIRKRVQRAEPPAKRTRTGMKRAAKLALIRAIYLRDGDRCAYCDKKLLDLWYVEGRRYDLLPLPVAYPTLDHVVPMSAGGRWSLDNLVVACPKCNASKGSKSAEEFRAVLARQHGKPCADDEPLTRIAVNG